MRDYLVNWRRRAGWTQAKLAEVSGVSQPYISELERKPLNGHVKPRTRKALADALKKKPDQLLFGPDNRRRAAIARERRKAAVPLEGDRV